MSYLDNKILGKINAKSVTLGKGVVVEEGVVISSKTGPADKVVLGDFCFIGEHTKIFCPEFRLGDRRCRYQAVAGRAEPTRCPAEREPG